MEVAADAKPVESPIEAPAAGAGDASDRKLAPGTPADDLQIRPLHYAGAVLLVIMFAIVCVRWITHPVHRASIEPAPTNYRINVNTADVPTLSLLSGISATISGYIIEHREKHGPFKTLADLDKVNRIGPTTIQKIAPYITFE